MTYKNKHLLKGAEMKRKGRDLKYNEEVLSRAVEEYINSDKSAREVAEEFNLTANVVLYHYNKRKEKKTNGIEQ